MAAFDWVELQTLDSDIRTVRSRLVEARKAKDVGRARSLEKEIAQAEARRETLLAQISTSLVGDAGAASERLQAEPEAEEEPASAEEGADWEDRSTATPADAAEGDAYVWNTLKPSDIERATKSLAARRVEMLARHAEELNGLDTDRAQVDDLEESIVSFLQKFDLSAAGANLPQTGTSAASG